MSNATSNDSIQEIDAMIERYTYKAKIWREQIGLCGSAMKDRDVDFLTGQIARLERLKVTVNRELDAVAEAVQKHESEW